MTFDPHPRIALGNRVDLLTTLERRLELIEAAGVETTLVAPFTPELQQMTPEAFVERYLRAIGTEVVLAGADFRFGVRRSGDLELLERLGFQIVVPAEIEGVSSTAIRAAVADGDVASAAGMLGRPFELDGIVVAGDQRGGTLGYPTANLRMEPGLACPRYGIYAGSAHDHRAAVSIGTNPHYGGTERRIEPYLLDFEGDLYGQRLVVELPCRAGFLEGPLEEVKRSILEDYRTDETAAELNAEAIFASPPDERLQLLESYVRQQVARALKVAPSSIDRRMPLTALGIDSLTAVELRNQTEAGLNIQLALTKFLQGSSISDIAAEILGLLNGSSPAPLIQIPAGEASTAEHPLSYIQQSLWFFYQLSPESAAYNNAFAARIFSEVNADALKRAFQALIVRHPCLRTIYSSHDGQPVQMVLNHQEIAFESTDCSPLGPEDLKQRLEEEAYKPFDLEQGPVIRVHLFSRSAREHVLLLAVHHIAMDGWSFWNLMDELRTLYPDHKAGTQSILPSLASQYTDYVRWQAEMLCGPEGERLWSYWAKELAGELPILNLPTDRPRPSAQTYRGDALQFTLSSSLTSQLKALADTEESTLYVVLLAAFFVMLHRYSSQEDILVGSPTSARTRSEFENIIGCFFNALVLRAKFTGDVTFKDFLRQVRKTVLGALDHQDFPSHLVAERLQPSRDLSRPPLFQATFIFQKPHRFEEASSILSEGEPGVNVGGLWMKFFPLEKRHARSDLELEMIEADGSLHAVADLQL